MAKPRLIAIIGPTASGKTDYAIQLAKNMEGDPTSSRRLAGLRGAGIVSADSRQVYTGMNVGTAKVRDTRGIAHHLLDIREPDQPMTLPEWQEAALAAIDAILAKGKQPILVGGTMLYIDSIIYNFEIPRVPPNLSFRAALEKKSHFAKASRDRENRKLYEELLAKDPGARKFIQPGNVRRIIRALEVIEKTGKLFSDQRKKREARYEIEMIGLFPGPASAQGFGEVQWDELANRIEARARNMFEEGLLEEMAGLREKYGRDLPLLQTLNYRQAGMVLDGTLSQEEAIADMVRDTMRYAHRQMSWWKGRKEITWQPASTPGEELSSTPGE